MSEERYSGRGICSYLFSFGKHSRSSSNEESAPAAVKEITYRSASGVLMPRAFEVFMERLKGIMVHRDMVSSAQTQDERVIYHARECTVDYNSHRNLLTGETQVKIRLFGAHEKMDELAKLLEREVN